MIKPNILSDQALARRASKIHLYFFCGYVFASWALVRFSYVPLNIAILAIPIMSVLREPFTFWYLNKYSHHGSANFHSIVNEPISHRTFVWIPKGRFDLKKYTQGWIFLTSKHLVFQMFDEKTELSIPLQQISKIETNIFLFKIHIYYGQDKPLKFIINYPRKWKKLILAAQKSNA